MASGQEARKQARSEQTLGYVSRSAQRRVDRRVMEIMRRRDAVRQDSDPDQALPARRFSRRPSP